MRSHSFILDEFFHYANVMTIINAGKLDPRVAPLPGYHAVLVLFWYLFKQDSLLFFRIISTCLSLCSFMAFYLLAREIASTSARERSLQYFFYAPVFVHFCLLYTDLFSLCLVLFLYVVFT